ncbi:MAG: hypothetical protein A2268_09970 [Candidatus Raymondbacteria bacterium RifOxyA12_full_50_37]|uniref:Uncharacterized protein n=1 Tax=Candidatus Raymondbacteria bacterium RIFOXYD12_FULL_49_13 TaxID=1817890 RepID=A0A1F7F439_UNCRA|nr:MAG: hypothetical protein A2350_16250 [Candidatus Raymondbacteria bacterium RifOxyB12_full_50_8]OGJ90958.1 MAG: hypothetical protein A2268_09970 [Candidatus Raymondbacteria bacterium RifOxyA12_full_50_37]OGJ93836.1 MAG: hypothetical protein A2248_06330 [Candidatus Raymondbacteria bacterium RIFOXYA2_FULL_49_16]OGJ97328.1 MAG: hypothetical protein A2487_16500 [Candidatus Raymondbacteria bacterium RifOxyC12_full_50_8]OGJ98297.1 MAG: hypothetical protein A2453_00845 [Candidatus Raymondbacteria b
MDKRLRYSYVQHGRLLAGTVAALLCFVLVFPCNTASQILPNQKSGSPAATDSLSEAALADTLQNAKPIVIKKDINASAQVKMGVTVMTFIIVVMVLANNFNPD